MAVEEVFDAELAWYAEFDDAPSKVMAHHWPGIPNHRDVTAVDWSQVEPVDIISGGSPCQDLSAAGRRAGMTEGTRSNLWVSMREAIATIKPTYVVWENVRGAYSAKATSVSDLEPGDGSVGVGAGDNLRALGRVLGDLADLGYDCQWRGLRAADVGAPHGRYRVFILATRRDVAPNPAGIGRHETIERDGRGAETSDRASLPDESNCQSVRTRSDGEAPTNTNDQRGDGRGERPEEDWRGESADGGHVTADTAGGRRERPRQTASRQAEGIWPSSSAGVSGRTPTGANWGVYAPAIARWETLRGTAPAPTELTTKGKHRLASRFAEWMMGLRRGHVTDVPGLTRNEELKTLGNGVVPQQAIAALKDMLGAS
ncbi:DNA methyltransferase [Arthrobacter phage 1191A]|nr:DNA methyltransferase [Arthrobacter phage 1191A]